MDVLPKSRSIVAIRYFLAFGFTPLICAGIYFFLATVQTGRNLPVSMFLIMTLMFYWLTLLLGIPLLIAFKKSGKKKLRQYLFAGGLLSVTGFLLLAVFAATIPPVLEVIKVAFLGIFSGAMFWMFVEYKRR